MWTREQRLMALRRVLKATIVNPCWQTYYEMIQVVARVFRPADGLTWGAAEAVIDELFPEGIQTKEDTHAG